MKFNFKFLLLFLMLLLVLTMVSASKTSLQVDNELFISFDDDNLSASVYSDGSSNSNDLTIVNSPTTGVSGYFLEAVTFDGSNDYATLSDYSNPRFSNDFTIGFNVKFTQGDATLRDIISVAMDSNGGQFSGYTLFIYQGKLYLDKATSSSTIPRANSASTYNDGDWHSVLVEVSSTNGMSIAIDGVTDGTNSDTDNVYYDSSSNENYAWIGNSKNDGSINSRNFDGTIDEFYLWDRILTSSEQTEWEDLTSNIYDVPIPLSNTTYFDVSASNVASVSLSNFSVLINGTTYATTNGTVNTLINQTQGLIFDVVISGDEQGGYFNKTYSSYNTSVDLTATGLYQSIVNVYPSEVLTGDSIIDYYNVTDDLGIVSPAYKGVSPGGLGEFAVLNTLYGNRTFTFSSSIYDYYDHSTTVEVVNSSQTVSLTGVYDYKLNFSAKINLTSAVINNFTVNVSYNGSYDESLTTTTGLLTFNLLAGYVYDSVIDAPLYAISNSTHDVSVSGSSLYNYYLWLTNSVYVNIYDEDTNALINSQTVNLEFISDSESRVDSTSTGQVLFDNLLADSYRIRYSAVNYSERSYFVDVANRGFQEINIFLLKSNLTANITAVVYNNIGDPVEEATVKMLKYYVDCNCYNTVQVEQTSFDGSVELLVDSYNDELYKFIISFGGVDYLETDPFKINSDLLNFFIDFSEFNPTETVSDLLSVGYDLSFNEVTNNFIFTFSDSGSSVVSGCLKVYKEKPSESLLINSTCVVGTASTINIGVEEVNGTTYKAVAIVDLNDEDYVLDTLYHSFKFGKMVGGLVGVFLTMILVAGFALISLWNPTISVILTVVALIFSSALGILNIGSSALMGVIAIAFILVVRNRS